jgi:hypothetical protein
VSARFPESGLSALAIALLIAISFLIGTASAVAQGTAVDSLRGRSIQAQAQPLPAVPPATACVEIIAAQAGIQPTILLDKCSGRTWQLASRRSTTGRVYVWRPLARQGDDVASASPAAAAAAPRGKCFTFDGRTFCE